MAPASAAQVSVQGVVPTDPSRRSGHRIFGNGRAAGDRVFAFVTEVSAGSNFKTIASVDLVSAVTAPTAFASDPQSCGPGGSFTPRVPVRPHERLDMLRSKTTRLVPALQQAGLFEVRQTRIGHPDRQRPDQVQASIWPICPSAPMRWPRTCAATNSCSASRRNLAITDYFRRARLPVVLRHRRRSRCAQWQRRQCPGQPRQRRTFAT
jgi:hypothetical protein